MAELTAIPSHNPSYCVRKLAEETIFLAEQGDAIHSLDELGTFIWESVNGERTLSDILDLICTEYEVPRDVAEADLMRFADDLIAQEIILVEA